MSHEFEESGNKNIAGAIYQKTGGRPAANWILAEAYIENPEGFSNIIDNIGDDSGEEIESNYESSGSMKEYIASFDQ